MKWFKITVDLLDELCNLTINDDKFNPNEWCMWDVERLRNVADFLEREIKLRINNKEVR